MVLIRSEKGDEVVVLGESEALDARGKPRDGLVLAQGVEGIDAPLLLFRVVVWAASEPPVGGERLNAELGAEEFRPLMPDARFESGIDFRQSRGMAWSVDAIGPATCEGTDQLNRV